MSTCSGRGEGEKDEKGQKTTQERLNEGDLASIILKRVNVVQHKQADTCLRWKGYIKKYKKKKEKNKNKREQMLLREES
jgi:hypothetical protein